ncbi:MAG: hypothetical protein R3296_01310 [Oleiphilaceae bacterium]|nr:hypothetical protein [Oleiphilaceae bacterium]
MKRALLMLLSFVLLSCGAMAQASDWQPYPPELPRFDISDEQLRAEWQSMTDGLRGPLPTADSVREDAQRWPKAREYTEKLLQEKAKTDERFAQYSGPLESHYGEYAAHLREAWRLLFEGRFREARDLGLALGPAGYFPGLYAQALYATQIETDEERREALLEEVITLTEEILPLAPDHPMIRFGNAYGKARVIEDMSATGAMGTGYTSEVMDQLEELVEEDPDNIYAITLLGGVHSGIVEKAGGFLARMTFGASKGRMEEYFERALALNDRYAGLYYEYARALIKVDGRNGEKQARKLLEKGAALTPRHAEEALQVQACQQLLASLD